MDGMGAAPMEARAGLACVGAAGMLACLGAEGRPRNTAGLTELTCNKQARRCACWCSMSTGCPT